MSYDISSIYKIENLVNGKFYIGSAAFTYSRWGQHRKRLRENKHHNAHLQAAWNKYGEAQFRFCIVEKVKWCKDLIRREQYWLDTTQCYDRGIGYNIARIAGSTLGISTNLGRKRPQEEIDRAANSRARDWLLIDPDGNEHKVHNLSKFCRQYGLNSSCLRNVAHGKAKQHRGWRCKKISKNRDGLGRRWTQEQRVKNSGRQMTPEQIEPSRQAKLKRWLVTLPNGQEITVDDMTQFCRVHNLRPTAMHRVGRGQRKHYKNYMCRLIG